MEYELNIRFVYMALSSVITAISAVAGSPSKCDCDRLVTRAASAPNTQD
jgi:hypothetical protein